MFKGTIAAGLLALVAIAQTAPVYAEADAGSYLAARQADFGNDFETAATYFTKALLTDPGNPALLEGAMNANVVLGRFEAALPIATAITDLGIESQIANLVLSAQAAKTGDWDAIFAALEAGRTVGPLVDELSQAWAHVGQGDISKALDSFDAAITAPGMRAYGLYHKAIALASVGDFEGAEAILSETQSGALRHNRRSAIAHAQILSQLDRNEEALAVIDMVFGATLDPSISELRDRIAGGDAVAYDVVNSPVEGMAEVYYILAEALRGETSDPYTLLYTRSAEYLNPDHTESLIMSATLFENIQRFELANAAYASVSRDDPAFYAAEIGRADALRKAVRYDAAIEVLQGLTRSYPNLPAAFATLGDTQRQNEQLEAAREAYSKAIDLYPADDPALWVALYSRAITYHQLNDWPPAEADFRAALELQPEQPQVLNYLGYSLVERGEKLDEALQMIETAVAARPDNGAIVDSLGWVLFQLGRYDEAVVHLEQAASLEAVDPIVNDHLGDVYWAVGREVEARFQWHRALSFDPDEDDAQRIRRKLEVGLDVVLNEEGADPIAVARDAR